MDFDEIEKRENIKFYNEEGFFAKLNKIAIFISIFLGILSIIFKMYIEYGNPSTSDTWIIYNATNVIFYLLLIIAFYFGVGFSVLLIYFVIRLLIAIIEDCNSKPRFSKYLASEIDYTSLKENAIEIRKKFSILFQINNRPTVINAYSYVGVELRVGIDNFLNEKVMICHFEKTIDSNSKTESYRFKNTKIQEVKIENKDNILSSEDKTFWKYVFRKLLNDGWQEILLKSQYRDMELYKFCIYKDSIIIIYEIKTLPLVNE